jgi:hypothetical protein
MADGGWEHWSQNNHQPPGDIYSRFYPAQGPYSSSDPRVVAEQMNQISSVGIDEVVVSWWSRGSIEDQRLPLVISAARRRGLVRSVVRTGARIAPRVRAERRPRLQRNSGR